ncbi:DEAD/DEAH box helicase family protein, partial [Candidatus Gracilibacteria bacterium]|nr:DEAD/DEAH box helicase family protein [Candidatus Gracilibacteria bacterium]
MILKEYQKNAVKELLSNTIKELGKQKESSALVFKAPTGSGKTIMMQNFLKHFCESKIEGEYCFLWISVNDLSRQSKTSFEKNLEGTALHFSELCDIEDKELKANEVLFINWESIRSVDRSTGEWKVLAMKENERNENLPTYLDNTHKSGRKVILIVDESHKSLNTPKAQELIKNYIKPVLQIEVSATPDSEGYIPLVEVNIDDVIKEGMIKKEVLVNENLKDLANVEDETDKIVLDLAFKKQKELLSAYKKENSSVKPLVLIQLPSEAKKTTDVDKTKLDRIIHILQEEYDMTFANQKLAIWLSEDKTNKELVDIKDSPVEALIFKQAIATGWDCPRAQILVMFREIQTITFEIQTVGRILRMPEWKHYSSEALNKAYVYTDLPRAEMGVGETAKNLIKNSIGIRNNAIYKDFALQSFYTSRTNYKDIGRSFYSVLAKTFIEYVGGEFSELEKTENTSKLQRFINIEDRDIKSSILSDGEILVDIDNHTGEKIIAKSEIETKTQEELITLSFEDFARNQVGMQFTNVARSYKPIIEALYSALDHYFFGRYKTRLYYQKLILNNKDFFKEVLEKAKNTYKPLRQKEIKEKSKEAEEIYTWQIPRFQGFTKKAKIKEYTKNILQPSYMQLDSQQETWFIEDFLETSEIVEFWYNNGKSTKEFFAVPWEDEYGERRSFYPDFIVHFTNGIIGIF